MTVQPRPLDPPMVPFALAGLVLFAVAALVMLPFRAELAAAGHDSWFSIAVAGTLWGFPGLATMVVHDRHRKIRRAREEV